MLTEFQASLTLPEEGQAYGEPEWMPTAEEVERARAELARHGGLGGLQLDTASSRMVAPGATPWPWLAGAALWVLIWPALIALRVGLSWGEDWLPVWALILSAGLHMLVLAGPVILAERDAGRSALRRRFGRVQTLAQMLALDPAEFEIWIGMLFRLHGYRVRNTQFSGDHGVDIEVSKPPVNTGLVQCKRYRGTVGERVVRELYGALIHERGDRAWLATTGAISRQAREWATGKPIELWDGQKLVELARRTR
ncbi:MAG: restriction endonuclease [Nitrososphaerales archaeon]